MFPFRKSPFRDLNRVLHALRPARSGKVVDRRPPAAPPGTLVHVGERLTDEVTFRIFDYTVQECRELSSVSLDACLELDREKTPTWIQVCGLHDTVAIERLLTAYDIHPLIQEDVLNTRHRPKVEDFGGYAFIAVKEIYRQSETRQIEMRHLSLLITPRVVMTFQEGPSGLFAPLEDRIRTGKGLIRQGQVDYLLWAILDAVTDHYRIVLDTLTDEVESLDRDISNHPDSYDSENLYDLKHSIDHLYRGIRPMAEIASSVRRLGGEFISQQTQIYWSDLRDHAVQANELGESLRETVTSLRELHVSALSQRLNEVMRVLTAIATIFLPLTFVAGIYGMNFEHMPELNWPWAYPAIWGVFLLVTLSMLWYFRRRRWL